MEKNWDSEKNYAVRIICENCHFTQFIPVPKGTEALYFALENVLCPKCEVKSGWSIEHTFNSIEFAKECSE